MPPSSILLPNSQDPHGQSDLFSGNWLYANTVKEFIAESADSHVLAQKIRDGYLTNLKVVPGLKEVEAWAHSLPDLASLLLASDLQDQVIIIEYCLPSQDMAYPQRMDALICGKDNQDRPNAVIIELKQWERIDMRVSIKKNYIQIRREGEWQNVMHPAEQARAYEEHIRRVQQICHLSDNGIQFSAYAFLHNAASLTGYKRMVLFGNRPKGEPNRLYTLEYWQALRKRLVERVGYGDGLATLHALQELKWESLAHLKELPKRPDFTPRFLGIPMNRQAKQSRLSIGYALYLLLRIVFMPIRLFLQIIYWLFFS
ncbi:MAG: putative ATP/GTP-binding protein [Candidatus Peribacteria bacterium]|nr:putative ATP/GTP-binding protein [Candidatus Peribacteria bacterium]